MIENAKREFERTFNHWRHKIAITVMLVTNIIRLRIWSLNWSTLFSQFARFYLVSSINHHDRLFLLTDSLLSPNLTVSPDSLGFHLSCTWKPLSPDSLRSPFHLIILFHIIIRCHLVRKHSSENLVAKCFFKYHSHLLPLKRKICTIVPVVFSPHPILVVYLTRSTRRTETNII